jgi:hypothetical protein
VARALDAIRPKPFRGAVVAAGAVVLTVAVALADARMSGRWGHGALLALTGGAALFVGALAVSAPLEGPSPRTYLSALLLSALALVVLALPNLAAVLGGHAGAAGAVTWMALAVAAAAAWGAIARGSAAGALVAAASATIAALAAVQWIFSPRGSTAFRWVLLLVTAAYGVCAIGLRDGRRRHAVALVDAAGLAGVLLAVLVAFAGAEVRVSGSSTEPPQPAHAAGWGWTLWLLTIGFGLLAYAAVDRESGPGWIGAVLVGVTVLASPRTHSLLGFPLVLGLAAALLLVLGLRPTTPAPPEPGAGAASDVIPLEDRP